MRLTSALLADAATACGGKLFVHGGGIDTIMAPQLPVAHPSFAVALSVVFEPDDDETELRLDVELVAPDGTVPMSQVWQATGSWKAHEAHNPATVVFASTFVGIILIHEGLHIVRVRSDKFDAVELPLNVVITQQDSSAAENNSQNPADSQKESL